MTPPLKNPGYAPALPVYFTLNNLSSLPSPLLPSYSSHSLKLWQLYFRPIMTFFFTWRIRIILCLCVSKVIYTIVTCNFSRISSSQGYALISGQPGGRRWPWDIRGHGAGFVDFCCQFLARDGVGGGGLDHVYTFVAGSLGKEFKTSGICNTDHVATIHIPKWRLKERWVSFTFPFLLSIIR